MNFNKNELMIEVLDSNFETWSHTLDTREFVMPKYLIQINKMIFANMKKQMKDAEIYNLLHLQEQGYKLSIFQKLKIYFSGLRPLYETEKKFIEAKYQQVKKQENVNQDDLVEQKEENDNEQNRQENS